MMTKKQRLLAAIRRQPVDRVPVAPATWQWMRKKCGACNWLLELELAREYDFDPIPHLCWFDGPPFHNNIRILNGSYHTEGRAYGEDLSAGLSIDVQIERHEDCTIVRRRIQTPAGPLSDAVRQPLSLLDRDSECEETRAPGWRFPTHLERLLKEETDLEKIRFLLTQPTNGELNLIRRYIDVVGEEGLLAADCLSPLDYLANQVIANDEMLHLYSERRPFLEEIIQTFWEYGHQRLKSYLEAGLEMVNAVWYGCGPSAGWTVDAWRDLFLPLLKKDVELTHDHGALYLYNDHGRIMDLFPMLIEADVDVVQTLCPPPLGDADLALAKAQYGSDICLRGWIDSIHILERGEPDAIASAVRQAMDVAAPGSGFIIGTSQPITAHTPERNLRAYFDACKTYGAGARESELTSA